MELQLTEAAQPELDRQPARLGIEEILLLHHSHLDVGYTHSQPILWQLQEEFIGQALDWLEQTHDLPPDCRPKWTCEATEPLRRWLARSPVRDAERLRVLFQAGRIGVAALRWHISSAVDRAGLRRLLDGKDELEQVLGAPITVACQHDVNGVPWPLSDVLLDAGVDFFVMAVNPHLGRPVSPRPGMFLWEAPSGRLLRVFNGHHYTMFDQLLHAWDDSVDRMGEGWDALERRLMEIGYRLPFVYLTTTCSPILWDNAPPNPFMPDLIGRWNAAGRGPGVRYATLDDLRARAAAIPDADLPTLRGDWTDFWSFGYGSMPTATALNQRAKRLLAAGEALAPDGAATAQQAAECIDLYDEHTFGYWDTSDDHPQAQTTELLKQALAHEGHELASFAVMDALERIAANGVADKRVKGLLVCNPGPFALTIAPELPDGWFAPPDAAADRTYQASRPPDAGADRTYRASRMTYEGRPWWDGFGDATRPFGPLELPPHSWQAIALDDLPAPEAMSDLRHELEAEAVERRELNRSIVANHTRRTGLIESSCYQLFYEPRSGRILSILDRATGCELLRLKDGLDFFAFVRERTNGLSEAGRYAYYQRDLEREKFDLSCWHEWSPVRETASRLLDCRVEATSARLTFERALAAPGVRHLVQRVVLLPHDPLIRLEVELELEPEREPQGIYFAFPLAAEAGWDALYDTAGALVRLDHDQLPGACRNWVTVESVAAISDGLRTVALVCPDAPLVQFGDFHFGPPLDAVERHADPLLVGWAVNNYWDTNFPRLQTGRIRLRYGFASLPALDEWLLREQAEKLRQPPLLWPITTSGIGPSTGTLRPRTGEGG